MADDNIVQMPPPEKGPGLLVGPFKTWKVVAHGRFIPRLTGYEESATGRICLVVDGRFGQSFAKEDAMGAAILIGQAMAVASGYSNLEAETKDMPFASLAVGITMEPDNG